MVNRSPLAFLIRWRFLWPAGTGLASVKYSSGEMAAAGPKSGSYERTSYQSEMPRLAYPRIRESSTLRLFGLSSTSLEYWVARSSRAMTTGCVTTFSLRNTSKVRKETFAPLENRGRRECRMRAAPTVSCAYRQEDTHTSIQVSGGNPTFPAQWLYGL